MSQGSVLISGLGLMGGSLAAAATAAGWRVTLHHRRPGPAAEAQARGWGTAITQLSEAAACDLAVVCTPVEFIAPNVREIIAATSAIVTDVGSVKGEVCAALHDCSARFVGSHPMCGSHLQGLANADPNLYRGATTIVTPLPNSPPAAVERVEQLWSSMGCRTLRLDPASHDHVVAIASHLPHLLANVAARQMTPAAAPVGAGSFRDVTRVAGASADLWTGILLANRAEVAAAARRASDDLAAVADAIEHGETQILQAWLAEGRAGRRRFEAAKGM